jgi:CheY-like chemotaxis protein
MLLKKRGIDPSMAVDGVEALKIVLADVYRYDLIFMDNTMPHMVSTCSRPYTCVYMYVYTFMYVFT